VGIVYTVGLYPLTVIWPDGFMWMPRQAEYEQMILATFAVLGVYLLLAARAPAENRSLIGFAGWSSLVHGLVMLVQALRDPIEQANLFGSTGFSITPSRPMRPVPLPLDSGAPHHSPSPACAGGSAHRSEPFAQRCSSWSRTA
jgi:hypothetical protein